MNEKLFTNLQNQYQGKKVLVVGLGTRTAGSGGAAVKFFLRLGASVRVYEPNAGFANSPLIKHLNAFARRWRTPKPVFHFCVHAHDDVRWADLVVQNPGVADTDSTLVWARKLRKEITNDVALFFNATTNPILAITGTRGKSTTTALLFAMIKRQYRRARLGGNIGVSPLSFVFALRSSDPVVLELSSWLLHHLDRAGRAPQIAVITNVLVDHVNRYRSPADYVADKANIFLRQTKNDWTILNRANAITKALGKRVPGKRAWFQKESFAQETGAFIRAGQFIIRCNGQEFRLAPVSSTKLRGEHNHENILAAVLAAHCFGIRSRALIAAIKSFVGLPYRLEYLGVKHGVIWWNDSTATTPDATIAALKTFANLKKVILICGGESKGVPMKPLYPYLKKVKAALVVPGKASTQFPSGERVPDLKTAVQRAGALAKSGEHILFSPGTTWLPRINEFKRGDEFRSLFRIYK